jgi:hypothetical protein
LTISLLVCSSVVLSAQPSGADKGDPIIAGVRWTIHSKVLGEDRTISVRVPDGYDQSAARYPVLYALDGEQCFVAVSGVVQALPWARRMPELIIVAIHNTDRVRDFTTPWTSSAPPGPSQWMVGGAGGADRFLEFLKTELIPKIDQQYRTASFRILLGHSLGGLFALHAFATAPDLFNATIALSPPAFWSGDEVIHQTARLSHERRGRMRSLFVDRAEREFDDTPKAVEKIGEALRLHASSSLRWHTEVVNGEDHGTAFLPGVQAGLEFVFLDWRLPQLVFEEGLDSSINYYKQLSKEYGFRVDIPEGEISALALRATDPKTSVTIFEHYSKIYPRSLAAFAGLAEALEKTGDLQGAAEAYAKAVVLASANGDPRSAGLKQRLESLSAQLKIEP